MLQETSNVRPKEAERISLQRTILELMRDRIKALEEFERLAEGENVRLDLGLHHPNLVTRPEHAKHILHGNVSNYPRIVWTSIRPLLGDCIVSDGPTVGARRTLVQPVFLELTSGGPWILWPFVSDLVPVPDNRTLRHAIQAAEDVMVPLVCESRCQAVEDGDVISLLLQARYENGDGLDDNQVRDRAAVMFAAGLETTTTMALIWLFVVLDANPDVSTMFYDEIKRVVGSDKLGPQHLAELRHTETVLRRGCDCLPRLGSFHERLRVGTPTVYGPKPAPWF